MAMNTLISAVKAYMAGAVAKLPSREDLEQVRMEVKKAKEEARAMYLNVYTKDEVYTKQETSGDVNFSFAAEWDGEGGSRDTLRFNAFSYYKVADTVIPFDHVTRAITTDSKGRTETRFYKGTGCYAIGSGIMVTNAAGACELDPTGDGIYSFPFTAPSEGVYFFKNENNGTYVESLELNCCIKKAGPYLTSPSGKVFVATVDDSGTLTATEVTE